MIRVVIGDVTASKETNDDGCIERCPTAYRRFGLLHCLRFGDEQGRILSVNADVAAAVWAFSRPVGRNDGEIMLTLRDA